jgi:hypothetical protein
MRQRLGDLRQAREAAAAAFAAIPTPRTPEETATLMWLREQYAGLEGQAATDAEVQTGARRLVGDLDDFTTLTAARVFLEKVESWAAAAGVEGDGLGVYARERLRTLGTLHKWEDPASGTRFWVVSGLPAGHPLQRMAEDAGFFLAGPTAVCGRCVKDPVLGTWHPRPWTSLGHARRLSELAATAQRDRKEQDRLTQEQASRAAAAWEENAKGPWATEADVLKARLKRLEQAAGKASPAAAEAPGVPG